MATPDFSAIEVKDDAQPDFSSIEVQPTPTTPKYNQPTGEARTLPVHPVKQSIAGLSDILTGAPAVPGMIGEAIGTTLSLVMGYGWE